MPNPVVNQPEEREFPAEGITPLVSVVIPCYNAARYLAEAIESVLAQTYPQIEIIVIDDGSIDETASIARTYPVIYLYQVNSGISAARNAGIRQSRGKYVQFLDHDDRLLPEAIETGARLLEAHPECAMTVGEHRYIGPDGSVLGRSNKCAAGRDHYRMLLGQNFIESPSSALHRHSTFSVTGIFDETMKVSEDYEFYLRTARTNALIGHMALVSEYRVYDSSTSRNPELMLLFTMRALEMELPYVRGHRMRARSHRQGSKSIARYFGRQLTLDLIRNQKPYQAESQRKLKLLRRYYAVGYVAVLLSRLLPARLFQYPKAIKTIVQRRESLKTR